MQKIHLSNSHTILKIIAAGALVQCQHDHNVLIMGRKKQKKRRLATDSYTAFFHSHLVLKLVPLLKENFLFSL